MSANPRRRAGPLCTAALAPALAMLSAFALSACVAPEEPASSVRRGPAATSSAPPRAGLEPAPVPNRRMNAPSSDSVIRIQK